MKNRPNAGALMFSAVISAVFGAGIIFIMLHQIYLMKASQNWQPAPAQIDRFDIYQRGVKSHEWCIRFSFSYIVNGITYKNNKSSPALVSDSNCSALKSDIVSLAKKNPAGSAISIFYDQKLPSSSAIKIPQPGFIEYFALLLGTIFLYLAMLAFISARKIKNIAQ